MKSPAPISRRRFLLTTALASAAPMILPSWGVGASPNQRITLGFIGLGLQGRGLMGGYLGRDATQVVAVCDVDTNRRTAAKNRVNAHYQSKNDHAYNGCHAFEDFRDLLGRSDIDGVVIATPDHWHALHAIGAAEAGKDIYCEKPLCKSVFEARSIVKAVRKKDRVFQVGSMQRSMREFRIACELVANGVLGKIERVEVTVGGPAIPCDLPAEPAEPGLNWDFWLGPAPKRPYNAVLSPRGVHNHFPNWRQYREYGGGGVTDFGAHHFDIAQWGLGMDKSGPVEFVPPANWQTAQNGVRMRYENGVELIHGPGRNDVTFFGQKGVVQVDRGRIEVKVGGRTVEAGESLREKLDRIEREFLSDARVKLYRSEDHLNDWISAIRSRKAPICDVETGARTSNICNLVNLCYYHGKPLKYSQTEEKFIDGTGDPAWLDVPRRGSWKIA